MNSRHSSVLRGSGYTCDACHETIKEGEVAIIIIIDDEKLYFHQRCEPEKYRHITTIR